MINYQKPLAKRVVVQKNKLQEDEVEEVHLALVEVAEVEAWYPEAEVEDFQISPVERRDLPN